MIALVTPGHGSEHAGMGLAFAEHWPRARALLEVASEWCGQDARGILRRGGDRLSATEFLHPIAMAVTLSVCEYLGESGIHFELALGHSLGELSAWSALGGCSSEAAIAIAARRGRALASCRDARPGDGMLSVPDLDPRRLPELMAQARERGVIAVAVENSPRAWVLAGELPALEFVRGQVGGRCLPGTGAWHTPRMRPARSEFRAALASVEIGATPGLIMNETGRRLDRSDRGVIDLLLAQVDGCVRFSAGVATLREHAIDDLVLAGPSKVTRALLRENWPEFETQVRVHRVETPADAERCLERLHRVSRGVD